MQNDISNKILGILNSSNAPLETKEIEQRLKDSVKDEITTRTKIFYRLHLLRGEGRILGKLVGSGKGVWIWWRIDSVHTKKEAVINAKK